MCIIYTKCGIRCSKLKIIINRSGYEGDMIHQGDRVLQELPRIFITAQSNFYYFGWKAHKAFKKSK